LVALVWVISAKGKLSIYPINASILSQTWQPYNHAVYSEVKAAMKLCDVDLLAAVKDSYQAKKRVIEEKANMKDGEQKKAFAKITLLCFIHFVNLWV
jgi:hypothetical protein